MNARIKTNKAPIASEHDEQAALMQWAALMEPQIPELALLYAIPNGGKRHPAVASQLKAEGVKPGVPDLYLPIPRGGFHGLYLEMKRRKAWHVSDEQRLWLNALEGQGYAVHVCLGWEAAKDVILTYLGLSP